MFITGADGLNEADSLTAASDFRDSAMLARGGADVDFIALTTLTSQPVGPGWS
jgi:hypothetical protein